LARSVFVDGAPLPLLHLNCSSVSRRLPISLFLFVLYFYDGVSIAPGRRVRTASP
jgi:hypothetical protein